MLLCDVYFAVYVVCHVLDDTFHALYIARCWCVRCRVLCASVCVVCICLTYIVCWCCVMCVMCCMSYVTHPLLCAIRVLCVDC